MPMRSKKNFATGQKFGNLTLIIKYEDLQDSGYVRERWICKCDCGKMVDLSVQKIGRKMSCGCLRCNIKDPSKFYVGRRVHHFVLKNHKVDVDENGIGKGIWTCICDCGKEFDVAAIGLGRTKSCGCINSGTEWREKIRQKRIAEFKIKYIGKKFGALEVIDIEQGPTRSLINDKHQMIMKPVNFVCKCECGEIVSVNYFKVLKGENKSCGCAIHRKSEDGPKNQVIREYRTGAEEKGMPFTLTEEQFFDLLSKPCHYCGEVGSNHKQRKFVEFYYNGIDRVDNNLGYVYENCVPCCKTCNFRKTDMTEQDFYSWIERVHNHIKDRITEEHPEYYIPRSIYDVR